MRLAARIGRGGAAAEEGEDRMRIVIRVDGMRCDHCAQAVRGALLKTAGVASASVDLRENSAAVEFDEGVATPDALIRAIEAQGFDAAV